MNRGCREVAAWAVAVLVFAGCERNERVVVRGEPPGGAVQSVPEHVVPEGADRVATAETPELEEARLVAMTLYAENRALKDRIDAQQREIDALQRELGGTMAGLDVARLKVAAVDSGVPVARTDSVAVNDIARMQVLEVNRDQMVAVVSGGQRAGMKAGMRFFILRDERMIARVRLIDVRDTVAGGLIERVERNVFPEAGDRLVLSSKQDG